MKISQREFESKEVFKKNELKRVENAGYEAYRVSPRTTTLFWKKYKKVYGASVSPDYSRGTKGKYGAKVEWYPHGYTTKDVKSGTKLISSLRNYPVNQKEARMKLMLNSRKTIARRK